MINYNEHLGTVIKVDERYYYKTQNMRILTAWSLAGAKMYRNDVHEDIQSLIDFIQERRPKAKIKLITIGELKDEN